MFSRFFIDRPIFAVVISILITFAGAVAIPRLPVSQYPQAAPPTVQVDCNYPGANADVVAQSVAAPIEQQVNGVEDMLYMSSQSTSDGSYTLTVTFKPGVDLNVAQVLVQNRVGLALPLLPDVVRQTGVTTKKRSPEILLTVSLNCPDGRYDQLYLSNYAVLRLKDELARLPGIAEVLIFGQRDYSMRIWLDARRMSAYGVTVAEVAEALREQNFQAAIGHVGSATADTTLIEAPLTTLGRLTTPEEFGEIIVRATPERRLLRLKHVARVEVGARSQDISNRFDGKPTVGIAVWALPTANALATADAVKAKMLELSREFPAGIIHEVGYDTTPFIRESIHEVVASLRDAVILVALVVLVFLRGWRPAVIPLAAAPVAIIGSLAALAIAGYSLNNLSLFGLVLAIGIVVDDAIVVVEAVEQHLERGLPPRAAVAAALDEVTGPVIAVGLVLSAVFVPCAFVSGIVGEFFRQFALTIAVSTVISMLISLTLSPALSALLLRPPGSRRDLATRVLDTVLGWFFRGFDRGFRRAGKYYTRAVGGLLRVPVLVLLVYGGLLALTYWVYGQRPTGFIPAQDKGYLIASVQLPDAAAAERTRDVMARVEQIARETPGVKNVNSVAGNSFILSAYGSNFGSMFIILDPFDQRRTPDLQSDEILATIRRRYQKEIPQATVNVFPPPAVSGIGRAGGFKLMVEDRGDVGLNALESFTKELVESGNERREVTGLFSIYKANSPKMFVDIDRQACQTQGVNLSDVFLTLQGTLGSRYVNDFNRFGRTWQVIVQAEPEQRNQPDDLRRLKVRNSRGEMTPLGAVAEVRARSGPLVLTRYNMYPAAAINGNVAAGISTGQAIDELERLARGELPPSMAFEWTEITYLERTSTSTGPIALGLSVVFVFLVLAALYESWSLPLAVILVVPMCALSAALGLAWLNMEINVFTQIGLIVLVGLACKNAILIVEFAKYRRDDGADIRSATLAACALRLRPIMMTSFAFILGVLPLMFGGGAGHEMRRALGVTVFYGMLGVTMFGVFLTPVFFFVIEHVLHARRSGGTAWRGWLPWRLKRSGGVGLDQH